MIVATQMLHTMINNPRPTRAEVTDIANAIYYRTDALMPVSYTHLSNTVPTRISNFSNSSKAITGFIGLAL